jgi:HSP20 family protein
VDSNQPELERQHLIGCTSSGIQKDFNRMPWASGVPSVDIEDQGKAYVLTVDLPGFRKEDVNLEVTNDYVNIQALKQEAEEDLSKNKNFLRKERTSQGYYRRVTLPHEVDSDQAQASLTDGVLQVTLPKKERFEKKRLVIT